ncbi:hypothetical protein INT43_005727 [Umbelopsis isabellina]|uniref:GAR domain-containing protein n=1 Tax=Mortierella isabellina TaxID=91625 RepID=A0A8H7PLZ2_MORIS|nr:hypothetical protein INT43_005727 [Umbelopsis isabellina]
MDVNSTSQTAGALSDNVTRSGYIPDQALSGTNVHQTGIKELLAISLPESQLAEVISYFQQRDLASTLEVTNDACRSMSHWLNVANLVLYSQEQQTASAVETVDFQSLNAGIKCMQTCVSSLQDIFEKLEERNRSMLDDGSPLEQQEAAIKLTITKLQSEWSAFKHFFSSVTKQISGIQERKRLLEMMNDILMQIDELSTVIFEFQEKRHAAAAAADIGEPNSGLHTAGHTELTQSEKNRDDLTLMHIDSRVEPLFAKVDSVYTQLVSPNPPYDPEGILVKRHLVVQQKWESLRIEIDELKDELKEDRWLSVFRQVANQVDVMIDGLERVVSHCQQVVSMFKEWKSPERVSKQAAGGNNSSSTIGSFERITKNFLKAYPKSHHSSTSASSMNSNSSNSTAASTARNSTPPLDREKFRSLVKGFEAKYKYYTPAIDRMIGMLGTGISQRVTHDTIAKTRHNAIKEKWESLRSIMDDLRSNQLPEIERSIMERPSSPAWSGTSEDSHTTDRSEKAQSHWKGIRLLSSPSPASRKSDENGKGSNASSSSGNMWSMMRSSRASPSPVPNGRPALTHITRGSDGQSSQSSNRGLRKTHTPSTSHNKPTWNASTKTDSKQYSYEPLWKTENRQLGDLDDKEDEELMRRGRTKSPSRFGRRDEEHDDQSSVSWMKPTKSTIMRQRAQSVDRAMSRTTDVRSKTPTSRPKTPNLPSHRSKTPTKSREASVGQFLSPYSSHEPIPYPDRDRAVSPSGRRSETPSLIPRPKTPTSRPTSPLAGGPPRPSSRAKTPSSPSLIPRARSALGHHTPPVPPLPKSIHSEEWLPVQSFGSLLDMTSPPVPRLSKKSSTPALKHGSQYLGARDYLSVANTNEMQINIDEIPHYVPDSKDPLDVEIGKILNASPIAIKCQRSPQGGGRYYFGNDLSPSLGGGKKMYLCRLMNYAEKSNVDPSLLSSRTRSKVSSSRNKVLVRIGGGWQDLEIFLLEHASLMVSDVVVRSFTT